MIQCLGLCVSNAGGVSSIPGWEIKIPHATWLGKNLKKKIKQNCLILVLILNKKLKKK